MSNKDWQNLVSSEKRNQFVDNLYQAMILLGKTDAGNKQNLLNEARLLETQFFDTAVSRAEYYNNIAQEIYKIGGSTNEEIEEQDSFADFGLLANLNLK